MSEKPKAAVVTEPLNHTAAQSVWTKDHLREFTHPARVGEGDQLVEEDLAYVKDARVLIRRRLGGGMSRWSVWIALALFVGLIWWASWAEIEEVTRGIGKVIPSKSVQIIQSLEGGILQNIYVEEGQMVAKGQPLLQIGDAIFASSYNENVVKRDALQARLCRLEAEAASFAELNTYGVFNSCAQRDVAATCSNSMRSAIIYDRIRSGETGCCSSTNP